MEKTLARQGEKNYLQYTKGEMQNMVRNTYNRKDTGEILLTKQG